MPTTTDSRVREASKPLFGNTYRLELLAIIGELDGPFYARQIAARMGVADNLVTSQLARLCDLGLLEKRIASPHVMYTRRESQTWELARHLRAEFDEGGVSAAEARPYFEHVVEASPREAGDVLAALATAPVAREVPGSPSHRYLDEYIAKPWGYEYRVYDDALVDAWVVVLTPDQATSLHAHSRKVTALLVLDGHGALLTGGGREHAIAPKTVVRIAPGAVTSCRAGNEGLRFVEVETPRDKLDLVRLDDRYGRRAAGYETAEWASHHVLPPLEGLLRGPPRARVRQRGALGGYEFGLETGVEIGDRSRPPMFAVGLDPGRLLRRDFVVLGGDASTATDSAQHYFTVRDVTARWPSATADLGEAVDSRLMAVASAIPLEVEPVSRALEPPARARDVVDSIKLPAELRSMPKLVQFGPVALEVTNYGAFSMEIRAAENELWITHGRGWLRFDVPEVGGELMTSQFQIRRVASPPDG